jgi:hypothetical protein
MISSIFRKTKPFNYVILLTFLFVFYGVVVFLLFSTPYQQNILFEQIFSLATLLFLIFLINFVVKRNKITGPNSFVILFFTLLIVLFPEVLLDNNGIFCTFFLLLAVRKLLSIKSLIKIKLKIFDASIWIAVSSFFYDWALLYMLLVFITIYLYQPKNIRNWLIPFIGFLTVALISYVVLTLLNKQDFILNHYVFSINITSDFILEWKNSLKLLLYILASLILFILTFFKLSKSGQVRINTMRLIAIFFFMGLIINLLESFNEVTPILITFFPTSVFLTIYIENMKRSKLKEAVLILTVIIPFIVLFIRFG